MNPKIKDFILTHEAELIEMHHQLHQVTELSYEELETTQYIARVLDDLEVPYRLTEANGVMAEIKGPQSGKTVLLWTNMSTLSVDELNEQPGKVHVGEQGAQIAMLLMAIKALLTVQEQIKGTVRLIFQPTEKNAASAKKLIDGVDNAFNIHMSSSHETGLITCVPGPAFAGSDHFKIHFQGLGGHAAQPHMTHDAVVMATEYINNIQSIVSRAVDPLEAAVLTVGRFESGDQFNIIAENAYLEGTVRTFNQKTRDLVETQMKHYAEQMAAMYHGTVDFDYRHLTEAVVNHEGSAKLVKVMTEKTFGNQQISHDVLTMSADTFGFNLTQLPGAIATLGCRNILKATDYPSHHHVQINVDEDALKFGAELYAQYALSYLDQDEF